MQEKRSYQCYHLSLSGKIFYKILLAPHLSESYPLHPPRTPSEDPPQPTGIATNSMPARTTLYRVAAPRLTDGTPVD